MISYIAPVPIGNAVRMSFNPPAGSEQTLVLRNLTGSFTGPTDPTASLVFQGQDDGVIDFGCLLNGTLYYYAAFDWVDGAWVASPVVSCTPVATSTSVSDDPLEIVQARLRAGLQTFVAAGALQHDNGSIPVLTAPPVYDSNTKFPIVSVHLAGDSPSEWGIGDDLTGDEFDPTTGLYTDDLGVLARVELDIIGWVIGNPDTRITLRKAIRTILIGNLGVFGQAGMSQISISQSDTEDFESYNAPCYQTQTRFSCLVPQVVIAPSAQPLADIDVADPFA